MESAPVWDWVLKMMSSIYEPETPCAEMDGETKIGVILASLPESFNQFILNYNMNKIMIILSELLNMLQSAKELIKKEKRSLKGQVNKFWTQAQREKNFKKKNVSV